MYRLTTEQQAFLLTQPESGMGYQLVDLVTDSGQRVEAVAYNAELTLPWSAAPDMRTLYAALAAGRIKAGGPGREVKEIRLRAQAAHKGSHAVLEDRSAYGRERRQHGPAKDAPPEKTNGGEIFRRFSAFAAPASVRYLPRHGLPASWPVSASMAPAPNRQQSCAPYAKGRVAHASR